MTMVLASLSVDKYEEFRRRAVVMLAGSILLFVLSLGAHVPVADSCARSIQSLKM